MTKSKHSLTEVQIAPVLVHGLDAFDLVHGEHSRASLLDAISLILTVRRLVVGQWLGHQASILRNTYIETTIIHATTKEREDKRDTAKEQQTIYLCRSKTYLEGDQDGTGVAYIAHKHRATPQQQTDGSGAGQRVVKTSLCVHLSTFMEWSIINASCGHCKQSYITCVRFH